MPRFAANLGYLFTEHALLERIDAASAAGFKAIELQFPYDVPAAAVKTAIARNKLTILGTNTPPGERDGEFGLAAVPGREKDWQVQFNRALDYAAAIGGNAVHCLAGKVAVEQRPAAERVFIDNLKAAADLAAAKSITLLIEPINTRDMPGYFLSRSGEAREIIGEVGEPNLALQLDLYHRHVMEGGVSGAIAEFAQLVRHYQCAGPPDRGEPDAGEIDYREIFRLIDATGYAGWIGCEYKPRGDTRAGLAWVEKCGATLG